MKDLITTIAAISIMMIFILQFSVNQALISRIAASDRAVNDYKLTLQDKGDKADKAGDDLAENISRILGCEKSEVKVIEKEESYEVRAPIKNVIACGSLLGISQDENRCDYVVKGRLP